MSRVRVIELRADQLAPYGEGLRALEADIRYPIADGADHFRIDHGARYEAFFAGLGDAGFLLALDGDRPVGISVGIFRHARVGERRVPTLYAADFKVARSHRGGAVSRRVAWRGLLAALREIPRWRIGYAAAMRGKRGDVMRSARGVSPLKLGRPAARLAVYFVAPQALAALDVGRCPPPPALDGIDLSPSPTCEPPGLVSTRGRKDLRLESTGEPWPLVHLALGPLAWRPSLGHYLRACGEALVGTDAQACFALDERLEDQVRWLSGQGISSGAVCTLYSLRQPGAPKLAPWVHLATSEI
jgi:hypothetical protein